MSDKIPDLMEPHVDPPTEPHSVTHSLCVLAERFGNNIRNGGETEKAYFKDKLDELLVVIKQTALNESTKEPGAPGESY